MPSPPVADAFVSGAIELPSGVTIPDDAVVTVTIEDVSIADTPSVPVAGIVLGFTDPAADEIAYEVPYVSALIDETRTYAVRATIEDAAGTLLYTSDTAIPVITEGAPITDVDIEVVPAPVPTPMASAAAILASPEPS
jgi:putative lipoprotein